MQRIFYPLLFCLLFLQCKKNGEEVTPRFIIAGDSKHNLFTLNYKLYYDYGLLQVNWASCDSESIPFNIDDDDELDIRFGHGWCTSDSTITIKYFYVSNNYGNFKNIEFSVDEPIENPENDTILFAKIYDQGDTISINHEWKKSENVSPYYLSYYYNIPEGGPNTAGYLSINQDVQNKYIGVRRKNIDEK